MQNRRSYPRLPTVTSLEVVQADTREMHTLCSRDLSARGAFLATDQPLPAGTRVVLRLPTGRGSQKLGVRGEVVRTVSDPSLLGENGWPGMGVRFVDLTRVHCDALGRYLDQLRAEADKVRAGDPPEDALEPVPLPPPPLAAGRPARSAPIATRSEPTSRRLRFRQAYARRFPERMVLAEHFGDLAEMALAAGSRLSAVNNFKLALSYDPLNDEYRDRLAELELL